jgi:hypothetical protein
MDKRLRQPILASVESPDFNVFWIGSTMMLPQSFPSETNHGQQNAQKPPNLIIVAWRTLRTRQIGCLASPV